MRNRTVAMARVAIVLGTRARVDFLNLENDSGRVTLCIDSTAYDLRQIGPESVFYLFE